MLGDPRKGISSQCFFDTFDGTDVFDIDEGIFTHTHHIHFFSLYPSFGFRSVQWNLSVRCIHADICRVAGAEHSRVRLWVKPLQFNDRVQELKAGEEQKSRRAWACCLLFTPLHVLPSFSMHAENRKMSCRRDIHTSSKSQAAMWLFFRTYKTAIHLISTSVFSGRVLTATHLHIVRYLCVLCVRVTTVV